MTQEGSINKSQSGHHAYGCLNDLLRYTKTSADGTCSGMEATCVGIDASVNIKGRRTAILHKNTFSRFDFVIDQHNCVFNIVTALKNIFQSFKVLKICFFLLFAEFHTIKFLDSVLYPFVFAYKVLPRSKSEMAHSEA